MTSLLCEFRERLTVFTEQVGKGVYWVIRDQYIGFINCLLNTVGMCLLKFFSILYCPNKVEVRSVDSIVIAWCSC